MLEWTINTAGIFHANAKRTTNVSSEIGEFAIYCTTTGESVRMEKGMLHSSWPLLWYQFALFEQNRHFVDTFVGRSPLSDKECHQSIHRKKTTQKQIMFWQWCEIYISQRYFICSNDWMVTVFGASQTWDEVYILCNVWHVSFLTLAIVCCLLSNQLFRQNFIESGQFHFKSYLRIFEFFFISVLTILFIPLWVLSMIVFYHSFLAFNYHYTI